MFAIDVIGACLSDVAVVLSIAWMVLINFT
jgi:hypothetical protein